MATNPHIYVSSVHGTNTGASDTSFASAQTGAMTGLTAGNVYDNLGSAVAGASPGAGDTIYLADDHSASYDNGGNITMTGTVGGSPITIISVDATAIDEYLPGATENLNDATDDYVFNGVFAFYGVDLKCGDNVITSTLNNSEIKLQDCIVRSLSGAAEAIRAPVDGVRFNLTNVDITPTSDVNYLLTINSGSRLNWNGGVVTTATTLVDASGILGGASYYINGVDLSSITTIVGVLGTADVFFMRLTNCKLHASLSLPTATQLTKATHRFEMYNCDDSAGNSLHRFYIADGAGTAQNNDATYVTATESWYEGSDKSSIEVITTALCSHAHPFIFELPAQYIDLGDTAKDTLTIDLVTDQVLTDTDIAVFLVYPDGTTQVQPNWVTSGKTVGAGNYGIDPLAAGTTLTASALGAGDWTGEPVSPNFYKMVLDTSGDPGEATAVSIRIEVYKASIAAGELFIHPLITVSAT